MRPLLITIPVWNDGETIKVRQYHGHFLRWECACGFITIAALGCSPSHCYACGNRARG